MNLLDNMWMVLNDLAPWLLFGLTVAGLLHVLLPAGFIQRHLGKGGWQSVMKAVLIGVPAPLCSCGVLPAAIGLRRDGASNGAAMGFLISTPQTGVDSILVSASFLGWPFALFKVASAFVTGMIGGIVTDLTVKDDAAVPAATPGCEEPPPPRGWRERVQGIFRFGFDDLLYMIWKWILLGVVVSAAIGTWVPQDALAGKAWATGLVGMLVVLAIATPLYVCAISSVPVAAALVEAGMQPGVALVFLMAGPAVSLASMGTVYKAFGGKILTIYLATIMGGSMIMGTLFDTVLRVPNHVHGGHEHGATWWSMAASAVLIGLLARYAWQDGRRWWSSRRQAGQSAEELAMTVKGMTCHGCVNRVQTALAAQDGVSAVEVDLDSGRAVVRGAGLSRLDLPGVVRKLGFQVD